MVFETVKEIIADAMGARLKVSKDSITENTEFIADLHADSVDVATIICDIEDEFNIEIEEEQLEGIETVGDVVDKIKAMI
ncbi:MAG: acyl carrier protein [Clostridia bacterium]|nr:acyl carrier protein [Clostridia bacterium]